MLLHPFKAHNCFRRWLLLLQHATLVKYLEIEELHLNLKRWQSELAKRWSRKCKEKGKSRVKSTEKRFFPRRVKYECCTSSLSRLLIALTKGWVCWCIWLYTYIHYTDMSIGGEWWMVNEWWNSAARVTFKEASEASEHQKVRPWRQIKATSRAVIDDGIFNHFCCLMLSRPPLSFSLTLCFMASKMQLSF